VYEYDTPAITSLMSVRKYEVKNGDAQNDIHQQRETLKALCCVDLREIESTRSSLSPWSSFLRGLDAISPSVTVIPVIVQKGLCIQLFWERKQNLIDSDCQLLRFPALDKTILVTRYRCTNIFQCELADEKGLAMRQVDIELNGQASLSRESRGLNGRL
jgi:hypothetical protein